MKKTLYEWQEECLDRWFANHGRGIVQAVTGSGKTLLALTAISRMDEKLEGKLRVKIVVPTGALMLQWNRALREYLFSVHDLEKSSSDLQDTIRGSIGQRGGGSKSSPDCKYMIYVINSARYELARQVLAELRRGENVLLIADECHHYESEQNRLIFEFLPHIKECKDHFFSLGLSATLPSGPAQHYLTSVLGRKIYHYGMNEASASKTICPFDIYHISLSFRPDERNEYDELSDQLIFLYGKLLKLYPSLNALTQKERFEFLRNIAGGKNRNAAETASAYINLTFIRKRLVCLASARITCTCALISRLDANDRIIIFGERISQADELYHILLEKYPEQVGRYHSKMGQQANKNTLERFRTGSIRILIACKAIDEGLDVPDASIGIILSGTSTQRQRIQRLGRIIRRKDAKDRAALYYLHITETSEDSCYLPDTDRHRMFELLYDDRERRFIHPAYDDKASVLLSEMACAGTDTEIMKEITRCLRLDSVRSDWMAEPAVIEEQIRNAKYNREKNYWVCMKKLH